MELAFLSSWLLLFVTFPTLVLILIILREAGDVIVRVIIFINVKIVELIVPITTRAIQEVAKHAVVLGIS